MLLPPLWLVAACATPAPDEPSPLVASASASVASAPPVASAPAAPPASTVEVGVTASATGSATASAPAPAPTADPLESKDAQRASAAVLALPGVKGLCKESIARGAASCLAWATDAPARPCPANKIPYRDLDCMWGIGLFETMAFPDGTGHANRMATFWVDPKSFDVKWGSAMECGDMLFTLPAFRELKLRSSSKKAMSDDERCKGALPYPTAPPP